MLRGALRRIAAIVAVLVGGTAAISLGLGALAGDSLLRSIAVGYYLVGAGVLLCSLALGVRGPMRADRSFEADDPLAGAQAWGGWLRPIGRRSVRKATLDERKESRRESLGLFMLGLLIVLLGTVFDPSRRAF
jgi:hypothetical protein